MSRQFHTKYNPELAIEGAAATAGLLLAQHILLYRWRGRFPLPIRYGMGVSAALIGYAHVCAEQDDWHGWYDVALIFAVGGLVVGSGHGARWLKFAIEERKRGPVPDYARIGGA